MATPSAEVQVVARPAPSRASSDSVGPVGIVLVIGGAILIGWWMLRTPTPDKSTETTSSYASIPNAGDNAVSKGCAGFGSEEAQDQGDRAAAAGDKEAFRTFALDSGGRHIESGERLHVTGFGQSNHRRVEDEAGKGLWVSYNCLTKTP